MLSQFRAQAPWSRVETVLPLLRPVGCPLLIQHPQCSPPRIQIVSPQSWPFQRWCVLPFPLLFPDKFRSTCSPGLCTCCFPSPGWPQPSPLSLGERTGLRHSDKYHFFLTTASSQLPKLRWALQSSLGLTSGSTMCNCGTLGNSLHLKPQWTPLENEDSNT